MKIFTLFLLRKVMIVATLLLMVSISYGATFTATASGNFSSSATWSGGIVPPTMLTNDAIIIPAGITVYLDHDLTLDGTSAKLDVSGTLTTTDNSLAMVKGTLSGTGNISMKTVDLKPASTFSFAGRMYVKDLNVDATFSSTADMYVDKTLALQSGDMTMTSGGSLSFTPQARVMRSGGSLTVGTGGSVDLSTVYNVTYSGTSFTTGVELDGTGLKESEINMDAGNTLTLASDMTLAGKLALNSGTLSLAGSDLTVNGDITSSSSGRILTTSQSDVTINSFSSTTDALTFESGSELKNLTINLPPDDAAKIEGYLSLYGDLNLVSGILKMDDANVSIYGDVSGSGMFSTTPQTNLAINTSGELSTSLKFDPSGRVLNNFTVSVGADNTLTLDSDLIVKGDLALTDASILRLNGTSLTLDASSTMSGDGKLAVDQTSSLNVFSTTPIDALKIDGMIGDLTFSTAPATTVKMASDLNVGGMLTLQTGTVILNGRDLTLAGNVSTTGTGTFSSTADSDIKIETTTSTSGALRFSSTANTVGDMTVKIADNGTATIDSDLNIDKTLYLSGGTMDINDQTLSFSSTSTIVGASRTNYIRTSSDGFVERDVTAGGSTVTYPIGTFTSYAPVEVKLNEDSENGKIQVGVSSDVYASGTTGADLSSTQPMVDATWSVKSSIRSDHMDMQMKIVWLPAMEANNFDRTNAYISQFSEGSWDESTPVAADTEPNGMFSITRAGVTTATQFAVFDANTITALNDPVFASKINMYPNPATDQITVTRPATIESDLKMEIYSPTGLLIQQNILTDLSTPISVRDLTNGNYFIRFTDGKTTAIKQLTKL